MQTMILGGCKATIKLNIIDLDFKPFDIGFNIKRANLIRSVLRKCGMYVWKCRNVNILIINQV